MELIVGGRLRLFGLTFENLLYCRALFSAKDVVGSCEPDDLSIREVHGSPKLDLLHREL
jgi:hypothetical protein